MTVVKAGDILVEANPFCLLLIEDNKGTNCDYCFEKLSQPKRCSGCRKMYYCSKDCARGDWKMGHKFKECNILNANDLLAMILLIPGQSRELAMRLVTSLKFVMRLTLKKQFDPNYGKRFKTDGRTELGFEDLSYTVRLEDRQFMSPFLAVVQLALKQVDVHSQLSELEDIFFKYKENSIGVAPGILRVEKLPIGRCIYVHQRFQHSCCANSNRVYDGTKLYIRAIRDFDSTLEHPTLSLVNVMHTRIPRSMQLASLYGIDCECERCETNVEYPSEEVRLQLLSMPPGSQLVDRARDFVEAAKRVNKGGRSMQALANIHFVILLLKARQLHWQVAEFERELELTASILYGTEGVDRVKAVHENCTLVSWFNDREG